MKQFFKFMLASMLGVIISSIILVFVAIGMVGAIVASAGKEDKKEIEANSILQLKLDYVIPERSSNNPFEQFNFATLESTKSSGLTEVIKAIKAAKTNENIKGIFLHLSISPNDYATLESIRNELIDFKKSKKFIIAYGEVMEEHSYYLASVADEIYINPAGELLIDGFSSSTPYLKGMFDKIGIEPQLIRHGKYKSAGEPLISNKMSAENRQQIEAYVGSMYNNYLAAIAASRKKSVAEVQAMADDLLIQTPEDAKRLGMITGVLFEDEVQQILTKKVGKTKFEDVKFVSTKAAADALKETPFSVKEKIAVIYCVGDIVSGKGDQETMGSESIVASLRKAKNDSNVKAVVLRINSPGGSALASDVIWREVILTKKVKPVVVSMGAVAASGGYYIAAPADVIVAQPNTVTGSIGVFALLLNAEKLIKDKLGVNIETVNFGKYADMGTPTRPLTASEQAIMQKFIDRIYNDFISKVAEGRKLTTAQVDEIAQGRVWSGTEAKKIGLIDEFGGLDKAIEIAAQKAKLKEYRTLQLPEQKDAFEELLKNMGDNAQAIMTKQYLGEQYEWYNNLKKAVQYEGIQMRFTLPANID
ncbi:MAG: signal peptide peptidase SppA [Bacteroidetes bacterium]|nr:MAG: signal peptide peptidase SppA [Bacteroidota bacterium]